MRDTSVPELNEKTERILRHTRRQEREVYAVKKMTELTGGSIGEAKEW